MRRLTAWTTPALLLTLAACAAAGSGGTPTAGPEARASAETIAACRTRANEIYDQRHRDTIYRDSSGANTPFSSNYAPGIQDRGLSQLFEHDTVMSDCVRNIGAEGDRTPVHAAAPPPIIKRP